MHHVRGRLLGQTNICQTPATVMELRRLTAGTLRTLSLGRTLRALLVVEKSPPPHCRHASDRLQVALRPQGHECARKRLCEPLSGTDRSLLLLGPGLSR